jgi:hypothetical protein
VDREDVRVLEPGGELDLAKEALGAEGGSELGVKNLQSNRAVVPEIVGEKYRGHAATAKLPLDTVAISQAALELLA